jgi:tripartite-type tricarboxylate transporter receptor subunit TctC
MNLTRRDFSAALVGTGAALAWDAALSWPAPSLHLLVAFPQGNGAHQLARLLAKGLKEEMGVIVGIENAEGDPGQLAAQVSRLDAPSVTTLLLSRDHFVSVQRLLSKSRSTGFIDHFVPVAGLATEGYALAVSGRTPVQTFGDYKAWVTQTNTVEVGVPALNSMEYMLIRGMGQMYRPRPDDLVPIPYHGSALLLRDMLDHRIAAAMAPASDWIEHHRSGQLRVVAVTGHARQAALPEVPTFAELGEGYHDQTSGYGLFASRNTSPAHLHLVGESVKKVLKRQSLRSALTAHGLVVDFMPANRLVNVETRQVDRWATIKYTFGNAENTYLEQWGRYPHKVWTGP